MTFDAVLRRAPSIHVQRPFEQGRLLEAKPWDDLQKSHLPGFCIGIGTIVDPFRYKGAVSVSPHFVIMDLWFHRRDLARSSTPYISVNDWLLKMTPEGVIANDGVFTKLMP